MPAAAPNDGTSAPLVSVVTPVYNGERYLAECIESVLAQTYPHWEYVIVDNASTDRTGEIARAYAARDRRIRVVTNERLVGVIENHNIAFRQVSPRARYCKVAQADDVLFPECLAAMVGIAEAHPRVGLVCAYRLQGDWVDLDGLPYPSPVVPGRVIARWSLLGFPYVFGSPTSHLIRADFVRARPAFYDESNLHADEAACYEVLKSADLGFVHQVLTYTRVHDETITTSVARRLNTFLPGQLAILDRYGPVFLTAEEYRRRRAERLAEYYRFLALVLLAGRDRETWRYHQERLAALGEPFRVSRLLRALGRLVLRVALSPGRDLPKVWQVIRCGPDGLSPAVGEELGAVLDRARFHGLVKAVERADASRVRAAVDVPRGAVPIPSPSQPDAAHRVA
ncbi:MAG TPA: glycosyltransferase family 2 protein [Candidatus Tectomicrobia bacterium]|nr:glycosyltransferase family 2 protein [Candidatus Tectomicrobia bacterium]